MKIFISWSGAKSLAVAEVLREELRCFINDLEFFVSSEDIEKGSAWLPKIAAELATSDFGIICVTRENLQSRWLHFEAGALAGKFSQTKVAPLLIELHKAQVPSPLSEFQLTEFKKADFFRLLSAINKNTTKPISDSDLAKTFDRSWVHLEKKVEEKIKALPVSASALLVKRSSEEMLEEVLDIVRSLRNAESLTLEESLFATTQPSLKTPPWMPDPKILEYLAALKTHDEPKNESSLIGNLSPAVRTMPPE